ncbi:MAG TPA: phosphatidylglycerophosphatase A [Candidatus Koribacter sp.]|jgi:phosphatidylglycerophosphatase A
MADQASPTKISTTPAPAWAHWTAIFFGAGLGKPGPGTWGSAATVLLWALIAHFTPVAYQLYLILGLTALSIVVGIPAATLEARGCGRKDPSHVVIDEVAGQLVTLIAAPVRWAPLLIGLLLFRAFDITKPFPIRKLEQLPEGTGIVVDDLGAGIYAWIVLQAILYFGRQHAWPGLS